jgi:hypothetical protein
MSPLHREANTTSHRTVGRRQSALPRACRGAGRCLADAHTQSAGYYSFAGSRALPRSATSGSTWRGRIRRPALALADATARYLHQAPRTRPNPAGAVGWSHQNGQQPPYPARKTCRSLCANRPRESRQPTSTRRDPADPKGKRSPSRSPCPARSSGSWGASHGRGLYVTRRAARTGRRSETRSKRRP